MSQKTVKTLAEDNKRLTAELVRMTTLVVGMSRKLTVEPVPYLVAIDAAFAIHALDIHGDAEEIKRWTAFCYTREDVEKGLARNVG